MHACAEHTHLLPHETHRQVAGHGGPELEQQARPPAVRSGNLLLVHGQVKHVEQGRAKVQQHRTGPDHLDRPPLPTQAAGSVAAPAAAAPPRRTAPPPRSGAKGTGGARSSSIVGLAIIVQMYISMSAHAPPNEGPYVSSVQYDDGANGRKHAVCRVHDHSVCAPRAARRAPPHRQRRAGPRGGPGWQRAVAR